MNWLFNLSGFAGLALFLGAYAMVNLGRWHESEARFHLPNLLGALLMLFSLMGHWNLPMVCLETCWGAIAAYGLLRARKKRHEQLSATAPK